MFHLYIFYDSYYDSLNQVSILFQNGNLLPLQVVWYFSFQVSTIIVSHGAGI